MAKKSFENSSTSSQTKSGPEVITPSWTHFEPAEEDLKSSEQLNKPVDKVKEGDVSSIKSKKVVYGAARSSMLAAQERTIDEIKKKGTKSSVSDIDISKFQPSGTAKGSMVGEAGPWPAASEQNIAPSDLKTPESSQSSQSEIEKKETSNTPDTIAEDLGYEPVGPFTKEAEVLRQDRRLHPKEGTIIDGKTGEIIGKAPEQMSFEKAKAEWKEARDFSDKTEKEFNEKYEKFLGNESMGWRKFANLPRRMVGLRPKMKGEILALYQQSEQARNDYFEKAKNLKDLKGGGTYGSNHKVVERYQRMLAHKLVVGVHNERINIQENVAIEAEKLSKIRPVLETMRKYRTARLAATALGYAVVAGGTGGLGGAILAGGGYGARVAAGMIVGGYAGSMVRTLGKGFEKEALNDLEDAQGAVKGDFFSRGFAASEKEIDSLTREVEKVRGLNKTGAAIVAVAGGFAGGATLDDIAAPYSSSGVHDTPSPVPNGKEDIVPQGEKPTVPESKSPVNPPATADTVPKVPNESSPKPEDVTPKVPEEKAPQTHEEKAPATPEAKPSTPEHKETTPAPNEAIPESPAGFHTVQPKENWWNIMEGRGPDSNPVGGKSEFLRDLNLPVGERQALLDKAVDYLEKHPELAKELGAVRSDGNIHQIYAGEDINITKSDELLRALYEGRDPGALTEIPPGDEEYYEDLGSDEEPHEPEDTVTDIHDLTLNEALALSKGVAANDPYAVAQMEKFGYDIDTLSDMLGSIGQRGSEQPIDLDKVTVGEYLNNSEKVFDNSESSNDTKIPEATPFGFDKPIPPPDEIVRDANFSTSEVPGQSLSSYVSNIEKSTGGFLSWLGLGEPSVAGDFERMSALGLTVGQIREMVNDGSLPEGVSEAGFDRWADELNKIAANNNELFSDAIARAANSRVA